jgi:hypothetical protein
MFLQVNNEDSFIGSNVGFALPAGRDFTPEADNRDMMQPDIG